MAKNLVMQYECEDVCKDDYGNGCLRDKILERIASHERQIESHKEHAEAVMRGLSISAEKNVNNLRYDVFCVVQDMYQHDKDTKEIIRHEEAVSVLRWVLEQMDAQAR